MMNDLLAVEGDEVMRGNDGVRAVVLRIWAIIGDY